MERFKAIKEDHREIEMLFDQIKASEEEAEKRRLFGDLKELLVSHSKAEERTVYKAFKENRDLHDATLEGIEEHHVADVLIKELDKSDPAKETWDAKLSILKENVLHHIKEEEGKILPKAESVLSDEECDDLVHSFEKAREERMSRR